MATTDTNVPQVIVNKLTSAEYATATKSPTEFYAVTDGQIGTADIADGAVTATKIATSTYSTSEQVVGTWTDGKPLYRRAFYISSVVEGNSSYFNDFLSSGVSAINLVNAYGVVNISGNSSQIPIGMTIWDNAGTAIVFTSRIEKTEDGNNLRFLVTKSKFPSAAKAIIEYTKTTD